MMAFNNEEATYKVLMIPMLAYGHVSPWFELAKKLTNKNFYIYFCSTKANLNSIKNKLTHHPPSSFEIVELQLSTAPPELPPHHHTSNGLSYDLVRTLIKSFQMSKPEFSVICEKIKPDLIIYDIFPSYVSDVASMHGIPAVFFICGGATSSTFYYWSVKSLLDRQDSSHAALHFPYSEIYYRETNETRRNKEALEEAKRAMHGAFERSRDVALVKSCRDVEGKYIDYFNTILTKNKVMTVGLLKDDVCGERDLDANAGLILQWLDKKELGSTIYVALGSESFLSQKGMEELAHGLELSNVNFIWAMRFPKGEDIKAEVALPKGFLERVGEKGFVVDGWAPQTRILGHPNIGGFVSHCGWSSVVEGLGFGVPIIGIPMNFDQPINARVVVELGAGLEFVNDEHLELEREEVARIIREVVVDKSGEGIRKKARELREKIRLNGDDNIDGAIEELRKICLSSMHV